MRGNRAGTKKKIWFWGFISLVLTVGLFLTLHQPAYKVFAPPSELLTREHWIDIVARSSSPEAGQLFAIPTRYTMIDEDWLEEEAVRHFKKRDLERYLKHYGSTLEQLKSEVGSNLKDQGGIVALRAPKTMHRYPYDYDLNIPLIFYGPEFILRGKFERYITQQHIVPTLAFLAGAPIPKGARGEPATEIFSRAARKRQPKAIVVVVIDMGGDQYFWAHPHSTPNISAIRENGADFLNAQLSHLDAETGPGHAAIGTGSYPANSYIYGNALWRFSINKPTPVYDIDDEFNPSDLKVPTLADDFDRAFKNKPVIISYCFAPRAAIGMGGHGSAFPGGDKDLVFWLSKKTFNPTTNTKFYAELPSAISELNAADNFKKAYPSAGKINKDLVFTMPAHVRWEGDMMLSLLNTQGVGKDDTTDLIFITFKSTDYAGHDFGWESLEAEEVFRETDNQIGRIKDWLDKNIPNNYVLVITADHGAGPLPEISGGIRLNVNTLLNDLNNKFDPVEKHILLFAAGNSYLFDEQRMKTLDVTYEQLKEFFLNYTKDGKKIFEAVFLLPEIQAKQKELLKR